jgi:leucyl-tRNA synthetase
VLNRAIARATADMESMTYKAVLRSGYFDLQAAWAWYLRRSSGRPHREVRARFVEVQTKILAPFAPHVCEEIWQRLGRKELISHAAYPEAREDEIDPKAEAGEALLQSTLADVREIRKVTKLSAKRVTLYVAPTWMSRVRTLGLEMTRDGSLPLNALIERALSEPGMRERARDVAAFAKSLAEELRRTHGHTDGGSAPPIDELAFFRESRSFLEQELGVKVDVYRADDAAKPDPEGRSRHALPGRPAIYVEGSR